MKIAWFSPLLPEHSDIANFTERLSADLQRQLDARFYTEKGGGFLEPANDTFYHAGLGPRPYDLLVTLNKVDVPIYNLGNNPAFFSQTWFLNRHKPGIVILHDVRLHHFFEGIYRHQLRDESSYLDILAEFHGSLGREAGRAFSQSRVSINFMAELFPMTAWAIGNALAVVVHTAHARAEVQRVTNTPVWTIPLPYQPRDARPESVAPPEFSTGHRVKIAIFGYLNTNRRVIEFLHALATMSERDCFEVNILGTVFHLREVTAAVELLGLSERVSFHGYVSEEKLDAVLDGSDLAVNLRYPTMGEASGSQLRIWDHALPSLVTQSDGYADLPPNTVCFVRPKYEQADIQQHLRDFLRRPAHFRAKGQRGRQQLLERHQPAMYVESLRQICERVTGLRSRHTRFTLADRVGVATASWAAAVPSQDRERVYATRVAEIC